MARQGTVHIMATIAQELGTDAVKSPLALLKILTDPKVLKLAYNQEEAAEMLSMGVSTLRAETRLGLIHRTRLGKYPISEMLRYLDNQIKSNKETIKDPAS